MDQMKNKKPLHEGIDAPGVLLFGRGYGETPGIGSVDATTRFNQMATMSDPYSYPDNYVKLRNLENHDRPRAAFMIPDEKARRNWLVFNFLQKGAALLYDGQEWEPVHRPGLFDADPVRSTRNPSAPSTKRTGSHRRQLP